MLEGTPFHSRTSALVQGAAWRRWEGYAVASSYELTHDREYAAIRSAAALIDVSPLHKYIVEGPDAARLLDRVVTRDVARCAVGQVLYTPWCQADGKVIEDGTVSRLEELRFRLTSAEPNLRWLHQNAAGLDVTIEDQSTLVAALALQGPSSREILSSAAEGDAETLQYFRLVPARIAGLPVTVSRTGYTGDLGYEIWLHRDHAERIWDALIEAGQPYGLVPAGLIAMDMARIEAGLLLLGVDYVSARHALIEAQKSSPFELNLGWAVSLKKPRFIGRAALVDERARGPAWAFVGIEMEWPPLERLYTDVGLPPQLPAVPWRTSVPLYVRDRQIGYATSGCWSPLLKKAIALAHVEARYAQPDGVVEMEVTIEHRRKRAAAHVRRVPFFNPERKRS
ncbi:MAG: aminomethyltransferase family protein [Vicinamibacteraceae bacterium]